MTEMKYRKNLSRLFAAVLLILSVNQATRLSTAADANPPMRMTYQGYLVDGDGTPFANTKVENYDIVFRIYDASQGGNLLWSEQQTVTVDQGSFSVLLGDGTQVDSEPRPSLDAVFAGPNASDRFVGLTVKGLSGGDAEILPRLRFLTSPYAFLSRNAMSLIGPNGQPLISTANGTIQSAGGDPRGAGAVDLQTTRAENLQVASGQYSVIGGGQNNQATKMNSTVGGGNGNKAQGDNSVIGGGLENTVTVAGVTGVIGGGFQNINKGQDSVIGGGHKNETEGFVAVVGGGQFNKATANFSTVSGGYLNTATAEAATIGGGAENKSQNTRATVGGGFKNIASGFESTIGGGAINQASGAKSTVAGGVDNRGTGDQSAIGGGHLNTAGGLNSTVAGGWSNLAGGSASAVGGGDKNQATGFESVIGGGAENKATHDRSGVGSGHLNISSGVNSFVGGGFKNEAKNTEATVGGGNSNIAGGFRSTVAGGVDNQATLDHAVVGGGHLNRATGINSTVSGGYNNRATATTATVAGGDSNLASGVDSFIAGGFLNEAAGLQSFAAGRRAKSRADGTFTWSDRVDLDFAPTFGNSFNVRASGGIHFYSNGSTWLAGNRTGVFLAPGSSSWAFVSDRNAKKNFEAADYREILRKLDDVPVSYWHYLGEDDGMTKNLGPVAQDFKQAFYPGRDDKSISTMELDGVELAAIKGLHELVKEKDSEIKSLREELEELRKMVETLSSRETNAR